MIVPLRSIGKTQCSIGCYSDAPCRRPALAWYVDSAGYDMHVCASHAYDAFRDGYDVTHDDGRELGVSEVDGDYVWGADGVVPL